MRKYKSNRFPATNEEKFNRIQLSADIISKDIAELSGFKGMLKDISEAGQKDLNAESAKALATQLASLGKNISKKAWSILFNLKDIYGIELPEYSDFSQKK